MAVATIRLCDLIASGYPLDEKAFSKFPAPSDSVRREVAETIKREYWLREIGFQTPDEFAEQLSFALCTIMPLYNLRRTADALDLGVDPLLSFDELAEVLTEGETKGSEKRADTSTTEASGTSDSNSENATSTTVTPGVSTTTENAGKEFDYPITGDAGALSDFNSEYATRGDYQKSTTSQNGQDTTILNGNDTAHNETSNTSRSTGTVDSSRTEKQTGKQTTTRRGTNEAKFRLLKEYRETLEDLNRMIAMDKKVAQCFYGLFA